MGWVRAAKGHEMDPSSISYKSGDDFLAMAKGRSNQLAVFLDSTGRVYSLPAHTLPSARGQGEPLTGRLNPLPGSRFVGVMLGEDKQQYLLASSAGYGFIVTLVDLYGKNRAGKTALSLPNQSKPLFPYLIEKPESDFIAAVLNTGHLLIFPVKELPALAKGKGNKIMSIPGSRVASGEEYVADVSILSPGQTLTVISGSKKLKLKPTDWKHYVGERGRRGNKLPRAFQRVEKLEIE